uniref:CX domain-containing protein n=1 Tax=Plectus sambesii TaxID=2011161 RepID=A0A914VL21_9BILA
MNQRVLHFYCSILVLLLLLLVCPTDSRKGSSGGSSGTSSSGGRGTSGSRTGVAANNNGGGTRTSNVGGSSSGTNNVGGSSSGTNFASVNNRPSVQTNYNAGGGTSSYSSGSGVGSVLRSNQFKGAIAGAAAGFIAYQAGKAIIRSASRPMPWGGRNYYWGPDYYQRQSGYEMCSMPIENDAYFGSFSFDNGDRPRQIVWSCRSYSERCCGYECCPRNGAAAGGAGTAVWMLLGLHAICRVLNVF